MNKRLTNIKKERLKKLEKLKKLGLNPYPAKYQEQRKTIAQARKLLGKKVAIAGRIWGWREHGGSIFADLGDQSEQIQIWLRKDKLGKNFTLLKFFDMGDFLGVKGKVIKTKAGEITLEVNQFSLLTKSLRPIPRKWYGLKDIEERSRKRYLDFLVNPEVRKVFEIRSKVIQFHREFLLKRGYLEVETPVLQPIYGGGLARPFKTYHNVLGIPLYLRISTELYLKRLIVGGFEKVFEIARLFRNEGIDKNHNPEFTMLETMEAYIDYQDNMKLVEEMTEFVVRKIFQKTEVKYQGIKINFQRPWRRLTMAQAVKELTGIDFLKVKDDQQARQVAQKSGLGLKEYQKSWGLILAAIFEEKVEKKLSQPTFIYDFPWETSPLAKRSNKDPRFVERFEHFIAGMECSNNYSELNDPLELAARFKDERKKEKLGDEEAHQEDKDFLEALEYGMPPTSGIGPGIDRLVMILANKTHLRDVILFPTMRPKSS